MNKSQTLRIFGFLFLFFLLMTETRGQFDSSQYSQGPSMPVPFLWYKADNIFNSAVELHDFTGNNHLATCNNGFNITDSGFINFNKALLFQNSLADFRTFSVPLNSNRFTVFTVYQSESSSSDQFVWTVFFDTTHIAGLTTRRLKTFMMDNEYCDSTFTKALLNTTSIGWIDLVADSATSFISLGNRDSVNLSGKLAEFILFDGELDSIQKTKVQTYLAIKYGLTLYKTDYVDTRGDIIWNWLENTTYNKEIAGIGRDTLADLHQKQSSADGGENIIRIGADTIAESNMLNPYNINPGDFLVWGSNTANLGTLFSGIKEGYEISNLSEKRWLMQVSGSGASGIPTQLTLDADSIDFDGSCYLVIDRSGSDSFIMDNCDLIKSDSTDTSNRVYFPDLNWDADGSGKDMFTFLFGNKLTLLATGSPDGETDKGKINIEVIGGVRPFNFEIVHLDSAQTWQWTGNSRVQNKNNLPFGEYMVYVTDRGGDVDSMMVLITGNRNMMVSNSNESVSTPDVQESIITSAEIFPNPTNGKFTINILLSRKADIAMTIVDQSGRIVKTHKESGFSQYLIVEQVMTKGVYCIELFSGDEKLSLKLVVE